LPTFGNNSEQTASYLTFAEDTIYVSKETMPENGYITSMQIWARIGSPGAFQSCKGVIFKNSDKSFKAVSSEIVVTDTTYTWCELAFSPSCAAVGLEEYLFGLWFGPVTTDNLRFGVPVVAGYFGFDGTGGDYSAGGNPNDPFEQTSEGDWYHPAFIINYTTTSPEPSGPSNKRQFILPTERTYPIEIRTYPILP
jgi:hypothetical protein